jgi:hypothetical protein
MPFHRVDAIALGCSGEGKMDRYSLASLIGTCEQAVLSSKNPAFHCSLSFVIVNDNVGILEETGKGWPLFFF